MLATTRFCTYIEVLFHFTLLLLGLRISFVIPRPLLYRGSLLVEVSLYFNKKNYPDKSVYS